MSSNAFVKVCLAVAGGGCAKMYWARTKDDKVKNGSSLEFVTYPGSLQPFRVGDRNDVAKILDTGVQYITASKTLIPTLLSLSPSEQDNRNSGQGLSALLPISDFNTAVYKASESYKYPCYLDATHMIDFLKLLKEKELSIVLEGYDVQTCNRVKVSESKNILYQMLTMSDIIRQEFPGMHVYSLYLSHDFPASERFKMAEYAPKTGVFSINFNVAVACQVLSYLQPAKIENAYAFIPASFVDMVKAIPEPVAEFTNSVAMPTLSFFDTIGQNTRHVVVDTVAFFGLSKVFDDLTLPSSKLPVYFDVEGVGSDDGLVDRLDVLYTSLGYEVRKMPFDGLESSANVIVYRKLDQDTDAVVAKYSAQRLSAGKKLNLISITTHTPLPMADDQLKNIRHINVCISGIREVLFNYVRAEIASNPDKLNDLMARMNATAESYMKGSST